MSINRKSMFLFVALIFSVYSLSNIIILTSSINLFSVKYVKKESFDNSIPAGHHRAYLWEGRFALETGDLQQAKLFLERSNSESDLNRLLEADILIADSEFSTGIDIWLSQNNYVRLNQFIDRTIEAGKFEQSDLAFSRLYNSDPQRYVLDYSKFLFYRLGNTPGAQEILFEAIENFPESGLKAAWYRQLSTFARETEDWDTAENYLHLVIKDNPNDPYVYVDLAWLGMSRDKPHHEIKQHLQKALSLNPNLAEAYFALGMSYKKEGDLDSVIKYLVRATEIMPLNEVWQIELGKTFLANNQRSDAKKLFEKLAETNPTSVIVNYELAGIFYAQKEPEEAKQNIIVAISSGDGNPQLYYRAGQIFELCGDYLEALSYYEKVLELDPQNQAAYDSFNRLNEMIN